MNETIRGDDLFHMGIGKGIEKTLYLDGEKLKREQAYARVYGDGGVDVFIYDQKLSKLICERLSN
jgi:hypothetical protein